MNTKIILFPIAILSIIAAVLGYISGLERKWNERNLGFQTLQETTTERVVSSKPIVFDVNKFVKSNFFRLEVRRVLLFDDCTQVEIYAENCGWHKISRVFYSYLEDKDNGFYIKIGDKTYNSNSVNGEYKYSISNLPINTKKLLVVNFDPIPRDTKIFTILTGRKPTHNFPDKVNIGVTLGRPKYVESDFVSDWYQREQKYKKEKPIEIYPDFIFDNTSDEIKISIQKVTIGYDYTYLDLEVENYALRTPYRFGVNNTNGSLRISIPNHIASAGICKIGYNGVQREENKGFFNIPPSTTESGIRLIFNTIPRSTRRISIKGLVGRDKISELQLKEEL